MKEFKLGENVDICIGYACKDLNEPILYANNKPYALLHYEMCIEIKPEGAESLKIWINKEQVKAIRKGLKKLIKNFGC